MKSTKQTWKEMLEVVKAEHEAGMERAAAKEAQASDRYGFTAEIDAFIDKCVADAEVQT